MRAAAGRRDCPGVVVGEGFQSLSAVMDCRDDGGEQSGAFLPCGEFEVIAVAVLRSVLRDGAVDADHVVPQRVEEVGAHE